MMTEARGASNEKAKRELGWQLRFPSWRLGFAQGARLTDLAIALHRSTAVRSNRIGARAVRAFRIIRCMTQPAHISRPALPASSLRAAQSWWACR
jgi:hypothetical protein